MEKGTVKIRLIPMTVDTLMMVRVMVKHGGVS